jgi:hypothetical protein
MADTDIRKGMPSVELSKEEFTRRYRTRFVDPAFDPLGEETAAIIDAAWDGYSHSRKAPRTRKAARALAAAVKLARAGKYQRPDEELDDPVKK